MHRVWVVLIVLGVGTSARAADLLLSADVGFSLNNRFPDGENGTGFGLDLTAGYVFDIGLITEVQVGLRYHSGSALTAITIPGMFGLRYRWELDVGIVPFLGIHGGLAVLRTAFDGRSDSQIKPALNLVAGAEYMVGRNTGIGVVAWYWSIMTSGSWPNFYDVGLVLTQKL